MQTFALGTKASSISLSPDETHVVVAGKDILRILDLDFTSFTGNSRNLRVRSVRTNLSFATNDIAWHPNPAFSELIGSASANGKIIIWNLNNQGSKQDIAFEEHERTVHRIDWCPNNPNLLLSGSQDSSMKLWDLRKPISEFTVRTNSAVRDVHWNLMDSFRFAAAMDSGAVGVWDMRRLEGPVVQISSRSSALCIDWNPLERNVLAVGRTDKIVSVWDVKGEPECSQQVQTISNVSRIRWRPQHSREILTCSASLDNSISVWDIDAPFIPLYSFRAHKDVPTDIRWLGGEGRVISSGSDEQLIIHSVSDAIRPSDDITRCAMTWDPFDRLIVSSPVKEGMSVVQPDESCLILKRIATEYKMMPLSGECDLSYISRVSRWNEKIAISHGLELVSRMWNALALLFGDTGVVRLTKDTAIDNGMDILRESSLLLTEETNVSILNCFPKYDSTTDSSDDLFLEFRDNAVRELVYTCIDMGDIQHSACIAVVASHFVSFPKELLCELYLAHIEQLRKARLWTQSMEFVKLCRQADILTFYEKTSLLRIACCVCKKPIDPPSANGICSSCQSTSLCIVCRKPVGGVFIWCDGCGHGGHAEHVDQWFKRYSWCPSGCLHECTLK